MADIKLKTIVTRLDDAGNTKKRSISLSGINESAENKDLYQGAKHLAGIIEGSLNSAVKVTEEELVEE